MDELVWKAAHKKLMERIESLEKEAEELRQNLWVWKGISFVLLVLYLGELGGWFDL